VARLQIIMTQRREHTPLVTAQNPFRPKTASGHSHRFGFVRLRGIVLKKSVDGVDQIFSASWKRFPNKNAEERMAERRRDVGRSKSNYEANESRL
jgi:hypothetical protein